MGILIFKNGIAQGGSYDGEKMPGDLDAWNVLSSDANGILSSTYGALTRRSATLYHTYGPAKAAINKLTDYGIGPGLMFRAQPDHRMIPGLDRDSARDLGRDLQHIVHSYFRQMGFYETQGIMFRGGLTLGDSLLFFLREGGMLTDLIEYAGDQINWAHNEEDKYTLGMKHDQYLRPTGFMKNDGKSIDFLTAQGNRNALQFMIKEQPRQLRGYPLAYSIINLAKNDDRHTDAITQRAVLESILIGSFETDSSNPTRQVDNMSAANRKKATLGPGYASGTGSTLSNIGNAKKLGPGNMFAFKKGEKVTFTDMKAPGNNFAPFKTVISEYIGMAMQVPPEVMLSKYSTSFTAHKGALNDFKKSYMMKRINFARNVMVPVIKEIAKDAIAQGLISLPGFLSSPRIANAYIEGNFLGPIAGHINPLQEVNANKVAVKEGFKLRSDVAAESGNEWDSMLSEHLQEERDFYKKDAEKLIFEHELANAGKESGNGE